MLRICTPRKFFKFSCNDTMAYFFGNNEIPCAILASFIFSMIKYKNFSLFR
ncbi:hypothetical protein [Helicobacter rodentium]|nr:hypothetical protein [Helicobacter rodentium]